MLLLRAALHRDRVEGNDPLQETHSKKASAQR
jgi:hypothetical protein